MIATKSDLTAGYHSLDIPWFIWTLKSYIYRRFKYQHLTTSTTGKVLNFSSSDVVREKDFWYELPSQNKTMNGFVECISETIFRQSFQCPLYKTEEILVYSND